jgi:hypothetical protein
MLIKFHSLLIILTVATLAQAFLPHDCGKEVQCPGVPHQDLTRSGPFPLYDGRLTRR